MPEEVGGFTITSIGKSTNEVANLDSYKKTAKYKKLGWCGRSAVKERINKKREFKAQVDQIVSEYRVAKDLQESRITSDNDKVAARVEMEKLIKKIRALSMNAALFGKHLSENVDPYRMQRFWFFRARARAIINAAETIEELDTHKDFLLEALAEATESYHHSDNFSGYREKAFRGESARAAYFDGA